MTAEVGLPTCRAALAFTEGRHADVVDELLPLRTRFHHFGGSHAQRDALQRTLLESALHNRQFDLAAALVSERLSLRDTSVYALLRRARLARVEGNDDEALAANREAGAHRARFLAAAR